MPKPRKKQEIRISKHRHCRYCGISVKLDEEFCSRECEDEFERFSKKRKYIFLLPMIVIIMMVIITLAGYLLRK